MHSRLVALFTLAFVLYVVASLGAAGAALDLGVLAVTVVAVVSALGPLWIGRSGIAAGVPAQPKGAGLSPLARSGASLGPGRALVSSLATAQAVGLAAFLSTTAYGVMSEILAALALPTIAILVLRLALHMPDAPPRLRRRLPIAVVAVALAVVGAAAGVMAALPPIWLGGRALIAPQRWALLPALSALVCVGFALALRLLRRRLGSDLRALAANLWATLGIGGSVIAFALFAWLLHGASLGRSGVRFDAAAHAQLRGETSALLALSALLLLLGHAWALAPRRVQVASARARELFASLSAFALLAWPAQALWRSLAQSDAPAASALWLGVPFVLAFLVLRRALRRVAARALAPYGGALLRATAEARAQALGASDYVEFAAHVLKPLRRAGGLPETAPRLVTFDPPRLTQLDAAGFARRSEGALPTALATRLSERPGEPLVRSELFVLLPRRPELASLVRALDELDALCVIPLVALGELEGALVIARGARREGLTLEELIALERLAGILAPISAGYLALERAQLRATRLSRERSELALRAEQLAQELSEQRAQSSAVRAGLGLPLPERDPVQYSAAMRVLSEQLQQAAPHELPLLLWAETGLQLSAVAQTIHRASGRAGAPFVIADGVELNLTHAAARLFGVGERGSEKPGLLELIGSGTLLLLDVCALPRTLQSMLALLFEERVIRPLRSHASYPFLGRIVATARRPLAELLAADAIEPSLARWFSATSYRVPPLRERPEDLESLLLLALDRSARVLGKPAKGVEAEALKALIDYDWPGNEVELVSIVERAVMRSVGERITFADLPPLAAFATFTSSGSFAEQEREILRRALRSARGNRTEAARALGLKRGTFVEKLHRLAVDDPTNAEN